MAVKATVKKEVFMTAFEAKKAFIKKIENGESFTVCGHLYIDCDNESGARCICFTEKMNLEMIKSNIRANHSLTFSVDGVFNFSYTQVCDKDAIELDRANEFLAFYKL